MGVKVTITGEAVVDHDRDAIVAVLDQAREQLLAARAGRRKPLA